VLLLKGFQRRLRIRYLDGLARDHNPRTERIHRVPCSAARSVVVQAFRECGLRERERDGRIGLHVDVGGVGFWEVEDGFSGAGFVGGSVNGGADVTPS